MKRFFIAFALFLVFSPAFTRPAAEDCDLGNTLYDSGKYAEALDHFKMASQTDPDDWQAYDGMARAQFKLGNERQSRIAGRHSLDLHPDNPKLRNLLELMRRNFAIKLGVGLSGVIRSSELKGVPMPALGCSYVLTRWGRKELSVELWATRRDMKTDTSSTYTSYYDGTTSRYDYRERVFLTCLEIPFIAKYFVDENRHLYGLSGTGFVFVLHNHSESLNTQTTTPTGGVPRVEIFEVLPTQFSGMFETLILGAGVRIGRVSAEARLNLGFQGFNDGKLDDSWLFTTGYSF